jgi:hypothetical protein
MRRGHSRPAGRSAMALTGQSDPSQTLASSSLRLRSSVATRAADCRLGCTATAHASQFRPSAAVVVACRSARRSRGRSRRPATCGSSPNWRPSRAGGVAAVRFATTRMRGTARTPSELPVAPGFPSTSRDPTPPCRRDECQGCAGFQLAAKQAVRGSDRALLGTRPGRQPVVETTMPPLWQLLAVVPGTALVVACLTAIPGRISSRRSVGEVLRSELA